MAAKKTAKGATKVAKKATRSAPPARVTKKDLQPANKSATPTTETKASAASAGTGARRYVVTLVPPKGRKHAATGKAVGPRDLAAPIVGTPLKDRGAATSQAVAALVGLTDPADIGTRAIVRSYVASSRTNANGRAEFEAELTDRGTVTGIRDDVSPDDR